MAGRGRSWSWVWRRNAGCYPAQRGTTKCHVEHVGSLRRQDAVHTEEDAARVMNAALTQGQMQAHTEL